VANEGERAVVVQVEGALQSREEGQEGIPQTVDGSGPVGDQVSPTGEQELELGEVVLAGSEPSEAGPHPSLVGDEASIAGVGLGFSGVGVAGPLDGQARKVDDPLVSFPQQRQKESGASAGLVDGPDGLLGQGEDLAYEPREVGLVVFDPAGEDLCSRSVEHVSPMRLFARVDPGPYLLVHRSLRLRVADHYHLPSEDPADGSLCSESWTPSPISMSGRDLLKRGRGAIPFKPSLAAEQNEPSSAPMGVIQELYPNDKHNDKEQQ
jgi:hypothetical protein